VKHFTILLVEDDTAVRNVLIQILSEKGFGVLTARDAYEAIRILAERHVDLLFTDIAMPSMDGVHLAKQAKLIRPGIKVLFATGYAEKAVERDAACIGRVLYKPFRRGEVIREVEAALAT
jgi:CheY-like chemotaxis protein